MRSLHPQAYASSAKTLDSIEWEQEGTYLDLVLLDGGRSLVIKL